MLIKRRISLESSAALAEPIVRREDLSDSLLARELLGSARLKTDQLLAQARGRAQDLLDHAVVEFWDNANAFLLSLEEQRIASQLDVVTSAEQLLNLALMHLLDESSPAERVLALVRNLAASQVQEVSGMLSCHPRLLDPVTQWLAVSRFANQWQIKGDGSMPPDALRLSYANGAFDIDWQSLRRGLISQSD